MDHLRRIGLFSVVLWSVVVAGNQSTTPLALPVELRAPVKDGPFQIVTSIRGLPLGVRDGLQALFGAQALDIAEPGAEFQASGASVNPKLPTRRLVAAGCSIDRCLVYYERGGNERTWRVALFRWTPARTQFEWGGVAPRGLASVDDNRNAILRGEIRGPSASW